MRYKLSHRLFVITLSLLLILMSATLIFQIFFFENFYEKKKQLMLTREVMKFQQVYSYQLEDDSVISNAMQAFEERTNSKIAIFSLNGDLKFLSGRYNDKSQDIKTLTAFCSELIYNKDLINSIISSNKTRTTTLNNSNNSNTQIAVVSPMSLQSKNDSIIISVASVQPIEEATDVISEFYLYIFVGFIFVSVLLSLIYSNLISKPLSNMNKVATKMSRMDFSEKCVVNRHDEIGNLANSLNFLSSNLDGALKDLQDKNKKLQEDIEKERSLEKMRKEFIDSVSHELKTPIGIIEGYAEGIKDGIISGNDILTYLDIIIDESNKMGTLVSNMLELSKLESGTLIPNKEVFNINRLINNVIRKHAIMAEEAALTFIYNENTKYSYVFADVFQMEQVLTNLITNAIKYTPSNNHILVSISEEASSYIISVINEGTNIHEKDIDKLFDKFYKIDKGRKRNSNSTGLGLTIVKNILDLHGFEYALKNIENGVCFSFKLPKQESPFK